MSTTVEKNTITLQSEIEQLRQLWQEARADESAGLDADEVFDELERKYQAIANAAGVGDGRFIPVWCRML